MYRANILICDEFRLIDKDVLDKIMRPMLAATRTPKFMFKEEYRNYPKEQNKEIYLTSAWFKSHYAYEKFKSFTKNMCLGFPFNLLFIGQDWKEETLKTDCF